MKRVATLLGFALLFAVSLPLSAAEQKTVGTKESAQPQNREIPPPKTLEEAHEQLEKNLPKAELAKIDAMKSEDEMIEYHFGLGLGMRNSWGLWAGGPLAKHMNKLGFHHPDDMSGVILETFWCKRHGKDFRLKERAAYYAAYWQAAADPPASAKDPKDGSNVDWNMSMGAGDGKKPRQIHVGQSKKTGRWLAYEYDKGVYVPDAALLKRITDDAPLRPPGPETKPAAK